MTKLLPRRPHVKRDRVQLTIGPEAKVLLTKIARKYNLETGRDWTLVDVLETCAGLGLRKVCESNGTNIAPLFTLRS
jgi:hypothetical protein